MLYAVSVSFFCIPAAARVMALPRRCAGFCFVAFFCCRGVSERAHGLREMTFAFSQNPPEKFHLPGRTRAEGGRGGVES